jgi:hypothetical protein
MEDPTQLASSFLPDRFCPCLVVGRGSRRCDHLGQAVQAGVLAEAGPQEERGKQEEWAGRGAWATGAELHAGWRPHS